jgi:hypothetical protein
LLVKGQLESQTSGAGTFGAVWLLTSWNRTSNPQVRGLENGVRCYAPPDIKGIETRTHVGKPTFRDCCYAPPDIKGIETPHRGSAAFGRGWMHRCYAPPDVKGIETAEVNV